MTGLSILASLKRELGDLDRVTQWIRAVGYVHCEPGFGQNAAVLNGFSDLIVSSGARRDDMHGRLPTRALAF